MQVKHHVALINGRFSSGAMALEHLDVFAWIVLSLLSGLSNGLQFTAMALSADCCS